MKYEGLDVRLNNIRRLLLSSSALVVGCVIAGSVSAQSLGGTGGRGFFPGAGPAPGEGGVGGGFGVVGQAGGNLAGGGGGGAGAAGGAGYSGSVAGGTGGTSGTLTAPAGAPGSDGSSNENGGGGGGGGGNGVLIQSGGTFSTTSSFAGGFGGSGGTALGGGGGGGSGGYGIAAIAGPTAITVNLGQAGSVTGGEGGAGGSGLILAGGNGGDGGAGAYFAAPAAQLNLMSGTISGGTGGTGGTGGAAEGTYPGGTGGRGGVGVLGSGLTIVNRGSILGGNGGAVITANNKTPSIAGRGGIGVAGSNLTIDNAGGTIAGGLAGDSVTRAYAVELTGGANTVGAGGTINGGINVTGGSLMPALVGSTVGTPLMINGPLTFANGTQYLVRLTPTANDSAVVTGTAKLTGASVFVQAGDGTYVVGKRTILTATTLATKFAGVSSNLAFLSPTLSYDATNVFLTIQAGSTGYSSAALTQNQFNFAFGLTNAANMNGGTGAILQAFNQLTVTQARAAFDSVSGEGVTATQNLAFRSAELFTAAIFDQTTFYGSGGTGNSVTLTAPQPGFFAYSPQLDAPRSPIHELADLPNRALAPEMPAFAPTRTWRAWGSGFGGIDDIHGNSTIGSTEQNNDIYGGAIGVDYQVTPNYLAGIAVGGSDGEFSVPGRATSGSTTGGHIAFYDLATFGSLLRGVVKFVFVFHQSHDPFDGWIRRPGKRNGSRIIRLA